MPERLLHVVIRTPRETVLDLNAESLRAPTETGQVGFRPRTEPMVIPLEPGLVLVLAGGRESFVGTAGGLIHCDGAEVQLLTPLAVTGYSAGAVLTALHAALESPAEEMEARATLGRIESSIRRGLRRVGTAAGRSGGLRP